MTKTKNLILTLAMLALILAPAVAGAGTGGDGISTSNGQISVDLITSAGTGDTSSGSGLEFDSGLVGMLQGCGDGEVLAWQEAGSTWDCTTNSSSVAWDAIGDPLSDGAIAFSETDQTMDWNTADTAAAFDGLSITITNDASTDSNNQRLLVVTREASSGTATVEALVAVENLDTDGDVTDGIIITSDAGTIVDGIDVSDAELTNSINIGANPIVFSTGSLSATDLELLDDGAIDLSSEVTGELAAGSYAAASIDGDDINSNIAGNGLVLTSASPDTLDIDLISSGSTGDTGSSSGLEFEGGNIGLLQGCSDGEILDWDDGAGTWDCASKATDTDTQVHSLLAFSTETPVTVASATPVYVSLGGNVSTTEAEVRTPIENGATFTDLQCIPNGGTTNAITAVLGENACTTTADVTSKAQVVMSATQNTQGTASGTTTVSAGECAVIKLTAGTDADAVTIHCTVEKTDAS